MLTCHTKIQTKQEIGQNKRLPSKFSCPSDSLSVVEFSVLFFTCYIVQLTTTTGDIRVETIVSSMATMKVFIFTLIWCLLHVGIEGRVVNLLQSFDGPRYSYGFSNSFNRIFDTSKYGILQLNNGLAQSPQMGSVFIFLFFVSLIFCYASLSFEGLCLFYV